MAEGEVAEQAAGAAGSGQAAAPGGLWYYLVEGAHAGPYTLEAIKGLVSTGYLQSDMLMWAEGRLEWQPLAKIPELAAALEGGSPWVAAQPFAAAVMQGTVQGTPEAVQSVPSAARRVAVGGAVPAVRASAVVVTGRARAVALPASSTADDALAAFTAEISAIEQEAAAGEEIAASPPPEERSFVDDDGTAYEWDPVQRRFAEVGSGAGVPDYGVDDMTFAEEACVIPPIPDRLWESDAEGEEDGAEQEADPLQRPGADKRKLADAFKRENAKKERTKELADKKANWFDLKQNTSVYISGLPADASQAEVLHLFSKCGVIKSADDGQPRVKVYREEDGSVKGDGLVTYLKAPSVDLAIQIIDGTPLREGLQTVLSVSQAKFEQKGDFVAKKKAAKKKKKKVLVKQEERELGWGGFDDVAPPNRTTVVLRAAFHPSDFAEDMALREDLEADIAEECQKMGKVEKVKIYHTNPEGVVTVKFTEEAAALNCIQLLGGRFFGGRQLAAAMWDGFSSYHVKLVKEAAEEQEARLAKFAAELEKS